MMMTQNMCHRNWVKTLLIRKDGQYDGQKKWVELTLAYFEKVSDNSFNENITPNRRKRKWPEN